MPSNRLEIDLRKVQQNLEVLKRHTKGQIRFMLMVKANGYGTDAYAMTRFYQEIGIDIVGVAFVDEALYLRRRGITIDIFVLNAQECEFDLVIDHDLQLAVSSLSSIGCLQQKASDKNKKVFLHLNVDTGMRRFGCKPDDALRLAEEIDGASNLVLQGIMTHFTSADDPASDHLSNAQRDLFTAVLNQVRSQGILFSDTHAANSSALSRFEYTDYSMARIGLSAFGLHASKACQEALVLESACSLFSTIVALHTIGRGERVSYGGTYVEAKEKAVIAVIPLGYYDGLHRAYSNNGYFLIHGKKAPYVGTICMDYMMCDVTDIEEAHIGQEVLVFGQDDAGHTLSCETFSTFGKTIPYEVLCCIGPRVSRMFINASFG